MPRTAAGSRRHGVVAARARSLFVTLLPGATGQELFTCEGSRGTEEFVAANGVIYALINPRPWVLEEFAVKQPRDLAAFDAKTGRLLWRKADQKIAPITLACDGQRLV